MKFVLKSSALVNSVSLRANVLGEKIGHNKVHKTLQFARILVTALSRNITKRTKTMKTPYFITIQYEEFIAKREKTTKRRFCTLIHNRTIADINLSLFTCSYEQQTNLKNN